MIALPKGWKVEREERGEYLRPERKGKLSEVTLRLTDPDGDERANPSARFDGREGQYLVTGGLQTGRMDPDEARARAAVLVMAADECDRLNAAEQT